MKTLSLLCIATSFVAPATASFAQSGQPEAATAAQGINRIDSTPARISTNVTTAKQSSPDQTDPKPAEPADAATTQSGGKATKTRSNIQNN